MSQIHQTVSFVCRSCRGQIRAAASGHRTFSGTTNKWKAVPSFSPSSTPELDVLFNDFREKLFIPDALSRTHQRLVYRTTRQSVLTNEPGVSVTIGDDEEVKLVPQNFHERPDKRASYLHILGLLNNNRDDLAWQNIFPLVEGLRDSKAYVPYTFPEQLTRLAVRAGQSRSVVKLFEQPKRTGFALRHPGLVRTFLFNCHEMVAAADFRGDEVESIARDVEQVAKLIEKAEHCGGLINTHLDLNFDRLRPEYDSRRSLLTIGMLLEMAAARCINNNNGKDLDGRVSNYLTKAMALSESGINNGTTPYIWRRPGQKEEGQINYCERPDLQVLLSGFKLASKVDGVPRDSQQGTLNSRMATIADRIDYLDERSQQLLQERQQRTQKPGI